MSNNKDNGNEAATRDALVELTDKVIYYLHKGLIQLPLPLENAIAKARAALSAPPRQCDVGTAEEQYRRFWEMCIAKDVNQCACCKFRKHSNLNCSRDKCFAKWAQMPYEAEEGDVK